jgi:hypothetical protein
MTPTKTAKPSRGNMSDGEPRSASAAQAKIEDATKHSSNGKTDFRHDNMKSQRTRSVAMTGAQASKVTRASTEMLSRPNTIELLAKTITAIRTAQINTDLNQ